MFSPFLFQNALIGVNNLSCQMIYLFADDANFQLKNRLQNIEFKKSHLYLYPDNLKTENFLG